jgi:AraC family transcriptional regulator, transcriptional activator of pobA
MEILIHHKILDLYRTLDLSFDKEVDFAAFSIPEIHPEIPFKSPVLRADYFSFILTKIGSGVYILDDNAFPFGPGTIYFTNPGHKKSYELFDSEEAYIITLTEKFLVENVSHEIFGEFPFLLAEIVPPKKLSQNDLSDFEILYKQILVESVKDSKYKSRVLGNLVTVLLLKIKENFWSDYNPIEDGNRNSQIVKSFKQLLESESRKILENVLSDSKLQVQYFAEKLSLHPNYLNSVIKSKTGRTVNDWISERTISIAKSLLIDTAFSSKEIAYRLGFSESTHFSRFFKKHTSLSPASFRKAQKL